MPFFCRLVAFIGLLAAALLPASAYADSRAFSRTESRQLARGELVTRPATRQSGSLRLVGGTAWQLIDAPADIVWSETINVRNYKKMFPRTSESRTVARSEHGSTIVLRHEGGLIDIRYYLKLSKDRDQRSLRFRIDHSRKNSIREAWGFFSVYPYGKRRAVLSYGIMTDISGAPLASFLRPLIGEHLLRIPKGMKQFIEKKHSNDNKEHYAAPSMRHTLSYGYLQRGKAIVQALHIQRRGRYQQARYWGSRGYRRRQYVRTCSS